MDPIILNDSDIRYGIIKIAKHQDFFNGFIGKEITVECNGHKVIANIPHDGYISRLTKLHRDNDAKAGTKVTISKQFGIFKLEYDNSCTQNLSVEESLPSIIDCIRQRVKEDTWQFLANETNVRAEIIDPILKELKWEFPHNIFREAVCRFDNGESKRVDYALFKGNKFPIIIEAKAIEKQLNVGYKTRGEDKPSPYDQIEKYLTAKQFKGSLGILTNGFDWWFVQDGKKLKTFKLTNPQFEKVMELLRFDSFDKDIFWEKIGQFEEDVQASELNMQNNFNVIYQNNPQENIEGLNPTETYNAFLKKHIDQIVEIGAYNFLKKEVITDPSKAKRNNKKQQIVDSNDQQFLIIRDYSTDEKYMLVQQIISLLGIKAEAIRRED